MDELFLEGLEIACRVGCTEPERAIPQSLRVDLRLGCPSMAEAAAHDDLSKSVDYRIADRMVAAVQGREFLLIERVAEELARVALADPLVARVEISLKKRPPVQSLEWAGVRLVREKKAA